MQQYEQNKVFNQNLYVFISMELVYLIASIFSADRMQKVQWSLIFALSEQRFPRERVYWYGYIASVSQVC